MVTNVNLAAPIEALLFLGTAGILLVATGVFCQSLIVRETGRAKVVFAAMVLIVAAYFAAMFVFSFISHDKLLARGEEKHFCELDCHLAYSLVSAAQESTIGEGTDQMRAQGQFTVLTIKTRFDENTIGPQRGNGWLYPNPRDFVLVDERGNRYRPVAQTGTPVTTALRPAESYTTNVVFDLPAEAKPRMLILNESAWETRLLIGHENTWLHGQTRFQI